MEQVNVKTKIDSYPEKARIYAKQIRALIYKTAELEGIDRIEESLKWGEPSFKSPGGSPVRMDWKAKNPGNFYIFFNCKTTLVETFRILYDSRLKFEGSRAIIMDLTENIPEDILIHCFSMALKYHKLKKLPLLGA